MEMGMVKQILAPGVKDGQKGYIRISPMGQVIAEAVLTGEIGRSECARIRHQRDHASNWGNKEGEHSVPVRRYPPAWPVETAATVEAAKTRAATTVACKTLLGFAQLPQAGLRRSNHLQAVPTIGEIRIDPKI